MQPEWFYKGDGHILRVPNQPLDVPAFADDGGEEGEIAGIYLIDTQGTPRRVGMATGNEFADHHVEHKIYFYLAPSKLRTCAIGAELIVDFDFSKVKGSANILATRTYHSMTPADWHSASSARRRSRMRVASSRVGPHSCPAASRLRGAGLIPLPHGGGGAHRRAPRSTGSRP